MSFNRCLNLNYVEENHDRTDYYGNYGSTPRLVIQGEVISAGMNIGPDDSVNTIDPAMDPHPGFTIPANSSVIKITITPQ